MEGRGVVELVEHGAFLRVGEFLEGLVVAKRFVATRGVGPAVRSHAVGLGVGVDLLENGGEVETLRGELVELSESVGYEGLKGRRRRNRSSRSGRSSFSCCCCCRSRRRSRRRKEIMPTKKGGNFGTVKDEGLRVRIP